MSAQTLGARQDIGFGIAWLVSYAHSQLGMPLRAQQRVLHPARLTGEESAANSQLHTRWLVQL